MMIILDGGIDLIVQNLKKKPSLLFLGFFNEKYEKKKVSFDNGKH